MTSTNRIILTHFAPKVASSNISTMDRLRQTMVPSCRLRDFLQAAALAKEPILVIVNDSHRATLTREAFCVFSEIFRTTSVDIRCDILVATGTHEFEFNEKSSFEAALLRDTGLSAQRVEWHEARSGQSLQPIGSYRFNKLLAERRFIFPIGSVEPHYFAGVTGPHKTVTIGCMSFEDIRANHQGALDPASDILRLEGNPIHDGVVAALAELERSGKTILCLGEVASGPILVDANVGDPIAVVRALLPAALETFVYCIDEPFDLLHLEVPLPLGRSLYQADKALKNNQRAVIDGGGIILEASCPEGVGASAFMRLLHKAPTLAAAREIIANEGYTLGDHKAVKLRELTDPARRGVRVALVSDQILAEDACAAGMTVFRSVEQARAWLEKELRHPVQREAVIRDAGFVTVAPRSA